MFEVKDDLGADETLGDATVGSNSAQAISISLSNSSVSLGDLVIVKSAAELMSNLKTEDVLGLFG